jgi:hypothetical protein
MQMSPTMKRVAALAAVTIRAAAGPVGSAGAAVAPVPFAGLPFHSIPATGFGTWGTGAWDAWPGGSVGPLGQAGAVIGPVIITTAPATFINTNNQVTTGGAVIGSQIAG